MSFTKKIRFRLKICSS